MRRSLTALLVLGIVGFAAAVHAETRITFRFNDAESKAMRVALDKFEAANRDIKVTLQTTGWKDARDQFLREAAVGQGPDVVHSAFVWTKEFGTAGAVRALDDVMAKDPLPKGLDDFIAIDLARAEGKVYGIPWTADTWAMAYRTDLLKAAGVGIPDTWADLKAASAAVKAKTGQAGFGMPAGSASSGAIWFLANFYWWSNGKAVIVKDGDKYALGVSKADIADAMRYMHAFFTEGHSPAARLTASDAHDPQIMTAMMNGTQAIALMPTSTFKLLVGDWQAANPGKEPPFTSGLMPKGSVTRLTHQGGRSLVMNAATKSPEAAWKLMKYLSRAEIFADYYTSQFPAQKSVLQTLKYAPAEQGFATQLALHTRGWGPYAEGPAAIGSLWNATQRSFGAALSGQKSEDAAADDLHAEYTRLLAGK